MFGAGPGVVLDSQKPTVSYSLLEPPSPPLWNIHRPSPPSSHPLTVGSVLMEV